MITSDLADSNEMAKFECGQIRMWPNSTVKCCEPESPNAKKANQNQASEKIANEFPCAFTVTPKWRPSVMNCRIVCISGELPETSFEHSFNGKKPMNRCNRWCIACYSLGATTTKIACAPKTKTAKEFVNNSAT